MPNDELQILSHSMTVHEFSSDILQSTAVVKGRAQNAGNLAISPASIEVNFYDANGNLIDSSSTIRQSLEIGEVWDFTVQSTSPDAWKIATYDIAPSTK